MGDQCATACDDGRMRADLTDSGLLDGGEGHRIYWEESGNPDGVPLLYLHGGPGGHLGSGGYRKTFDADRFRVIALEQRGCGRSTPIAGDPAHDLGTNTTAHLIADLELLRIDRGVDRWLVNGASWGCTLALAYARAHPDRVLGVVGMAVTTTGRAEVDWITEGVGAIFPEAWDRFASYAEDAGIGYERGGGRLVTAYAQLLTDPDRAVCDAASSEWALWEDTHISLLRGGGRRSPRWDDADFRTGFARLAAHYWSHDGFLDPPLLSDVAALVDLPVVLIHGRTDVSGPAVTAYELHRRLPRSQLIIDETEGHGGPNMAAAWGAANLDLIPGAEG